MKISIVGSRSFNDFDLLEKFILSKINLNNIKEIISGGAKGADTLASQFAKKHNLKLTEFLPEWKKYGKAAGIIRNKEIIQNSNVVFAFWDGKSKGTAHSIDISKKQNKILYIKHAA